MFRIASHTPLRSFVALAFVALLLASCGGKDTMASKSAAAHREAVAKGTPVGGGGGEGHEHGGAPAVAPVEMDHSAHAMTPDAHATHGAATEHAGHGASMPAHAGHTAAATDAHAGMQHDSSAPATMDHAQHGAMQRAAPDAHAGMQHDSGAPATMDHAQHGAMQRATPDAHAGHEGMTPAAGTASVHGAHSKAAAVPPPSIEVPNENREMGRVRPAATLQQDAFDAPAPSAVTEAQKKGH